MKENYLAVIVAVAMSQRSYPQYQPLRHICSPHPIWQSNVPKCRLSHASSVVQPPVLTSSPPRPSTTVNVAPQDTQDPSATSLLPHTKPIAHAFTRKSYIANQNNICPKPSQEDIADGCFSSTPGPYHADDASHPTFHCCLA
jgi:hypothetical protein